MTPALTQLPQRRALRITPTSTSNDRFSFSFSSEAPVPRSFGPEILSHAPGAADLQRLNNGAPLLWNHDPNVVIGVIETASISNGKGRAIARWGTSPEAQQRRADVEAGVLANISVGYVINKAEHRGDSYIATAWEALEISLVAIPADPSVGVNRSVSTGQTDTSTTHPMTINPANTPDAAEANPLADAVTALTRQVRLIESRVPAPQPIATVSGDWLNGGSLPLSNHEQGRYSLVRALQAAATNDWSEAGFERECSRALEQQTGRAARGFLFPANLKMRSTNYSTGTASAGGNLVETQLLADQFIDALRKRLMVAELGATMLPGLVGNIDIPRRSGLSSTYWVAEGSAVTASGGTFDHVSLSPKTVGALSSWTRVMQLQGTPAIEDLVRADLVAQVGAAIDLAAINGSGASNQPLGVLGASGIGSVAGGTNGASVTFDHLADLKREVAVDDADVPTAAFLTNAKVEARLSKTQATTGSYIVDPAGVASGSPSTVFGRRFAVSNQVPSNLTKGTASGTCSAVIYGNFADLLIGMWGATDVLVNPFGSGYAAGDVEVRVMQTVDIAVRHPQSFAAIVDALT